MSFESWKQEFYPVSAEKVEGMDVCDADLIEHSLLKLRGALPENVGKHGIKYKKWRIIDEYGDEAFEYCDDTCALCLRYLRHLAPTPGDCEDCPLFAAIGRPCDGRPCGELPCDERPDGKEPIVYWQSYNDPTPMIAALERALLMVTTGESD